MSDIPPADATSDVPVEVPPTDAAALTTEQLQAELAARGFDSEPASSVTAAPLLPTQANPLPTQTTPEPPAATPPQAAGIGYDGDEPVFVIAGPHEADDGSVSYTIGHFASVEVSHAGLSADAPTPPEV